MSVISLDPQNLVLFSESIKNSPSALTVELTTSISVTCKYGHCRGADPRSSWTKTGFVSRTRTCDKGLKSRMLGAPVFPKVTLTSPQRLISLSSDTTCSALPGLTVFGFKAYAIVAVSSY